MENSTVPEPPRPGTDAPFFDAGGKPRTLADYRGRGVVLTFWATWCAPCVREMPQLDRLRKILEPAGIEVLALDEDRAGALVDQAGPPPPRTGADGSSERKNSGRGGDRLVEIAEGACELWHCPNREPFASVQIDGHLENWAIRSKNFRRWVSGRSG